MSAERTEPMVGERPTLLGYALENGLGVDSLRLRVTVGGPGAWATGYAGRRDARRIELGYRVADASMVWDGRLGHWVDELEGGR